MFQEKKKRGLNGSSKAFAAAGGVTQGGNAFHEYYKTTPAPAGLGSLSGVACLSGLGYHFLVFLQYFFSKINQVDSSKLFPMGSILLQISFKENLNCPISAHLPLHPDPNIYTTPGALK